MAERNGFIFMETSAFASENVNLAFETLLNATANAPEAFLRPWPQYAIAKFRQLSLGRARIAMPWRGLSWVFLIGGLFSKFSSIFKM